MRPSAFAANSAAARASRDPRRAAALLVLGLALLAANSPASAQFIESPPSRFAAPGTSMAAAPLLSGGDASWLAQVQRTIEASEYDIRPSGHGFASPNRAQDLRFDFAPGGFTVRPRTPQAGWTADVLVAGLYRGDRRAVSPAPAAPALAHGSRLSYDHGSFRVDYTNDRRGMRQNFVVSESPAGNGPLAVALTLRGDLSGRLSDATSFELLRDDGSRVMTYSDLKAWDAKGTPLAAVMRWDGSSLRLEVDDDGATYPVTIDPLSAAADWTAESNQANVNFGVSLSSAGDVNGDGFSDVIVGASFFDGPSADEGRVFVYYGSATGLSTTADWTAESDQPGALFGSGVSSAGDVNADGYSDVIVGAMWYDNGSSNEGAAFVFLGSAAGLGANGTPANADWSAESDQADAWFGFSVASAGDVNGDTFADVIVGAWQYDGGQSNEGRAYVYFGSALGLSATAAWTAESNQANAFLGRSVGRAGDVNGDGFDEVIAGANQYDNGQNDEGAAFVYYGSAGGPSASPDVTLESNLASVFFGRSVDSAGDVNGDGFDDVIVGSPGYGGGEGRAWVYLGSALGLSNVVSWTAESDQGGANMGFSAAGAGDVNADGYSDVIVGAYNYDSPLLNEGAAFVFLGSALGLGANGTPSNADWTAESDQASAQFGVSVASAGDVNGDGYGDVIVGATGYDNPEIGEGRAFVYHGSCQGCFGMSGTAGTGNDTGWRMFASPTTTATRADLAADVDLEAGLGSALYAYDGTAFVAVTGDATVLANGRGYLVYIYDDDVTPVGAGGVAITLPGSSPVVDVPVSGLGVNDLWQLLGNPFNGSFDLSSLDLVAQGFQATAQAWDATGGGTWIPFTQAGGTTDVIAKGQGILVERATAGVGGTTLTFGAAGITTGGSLVGGKRGSDNPPRLSLRLEAEDASGAVRSTDGAAALYFVEDASEDWDVYDASKLDPPLTAEYALVAFTGAKSGRTVDQALRSHPAVWTGEAVFPIVIRTKGSYARFRIEWPSLESVPADWTIMLRDATTGATVDLHRSREYTIQGPVEDGRLSLAVTSASGISVTPEDSPTDWALDPAYPNPFNPATTIGYSVPRDSHVQLAVHDLLGRRVATLVDGIIPAGRHQARFDGAGLGSGPYFYVLRSDSRLLIGQMSLVR